MRIHFVGSEGVSMKVLAEIERSRGNIVTGSDVKTGGHRAENVDGCDLVVYTSAVGEDNVELIRARELKIPCVERAFLLGQLASTYSETIAVAGTHGKTTTTAMLQSVFKPLNPTVHIGGTAKGKRRFIGGREIFITEACEYRRSFLQLSPATTVILDVDLDHTDYYKDIDDMLSAYAELCRRSGRAIVNGDDPLCLKLPKSGVTFGLSEECCYRAENLCLLPGGRFSFTAKKGGKELGEIRLKVPGKHNVYNALAAVAAADQSGLDFECAAEGLSGFEGTVRRFELIGEYCGAVIYTDYAHHPKEIAASLSAARECGYRFVTAVFEPHTYTRTQSLMDEFAEALCGADRTVIAPVFPAREKFAEGGSAVNLFLKLKSRGAKTVYLDTYCSIVSYLKETCAQGEAILFIGAGDIDKAAKIMANPAYYL